MSIIPSLPVTLQNGTTADATQVMADFNSIVTNVNNNAANSGVNSNITQLTGLTTALSVAQGGTGQQSLTANSVLLGAGSSAINSLGPGVAGASLVSAGSGANPVFTALYPVGALYLETTGINPATTFGFGTWVAYAAGQAIVGVGSFTDGDGTSKTVTAGQQFGEYQHTLTVTEMPSHAHTDAGHYHGTPGLMITGGSQSAAVFSNGNRTDCSSSTNLASANIQNTGGSAAHNNIQPSIGIYIWQRTA